jgi:hypothetical protein
MDEKKRQRYSDLLELLIVIAIIFLIITIYVPVAIWEEEDHYATESHFRMENIYDIETFYERLTDTFTTDGLWAMAVVNAVRDSLTADSNFVGDQTIELFGKEFTVSIPKGYDVEYDTTFGFQKSRRDTIIDTTVTIIMYDEELSRNDTIYVRKVDLPEKQADPSFVRILDEQPVEREELVTYYDTYMPDSTMFYCPLTKLPYQITVKDNGVRISSPIKDVYKEPRYFLFSFQAENHGYIDDGSPSWD